MELVVVMALMGIIVGFALPRFQQMTENSPTDEIIQWVKFKALALREKAQTQHARWSLVIDFDSAEMRTVPPESDPDSGPESDPGEENPPEQKVERYPIPDGGQIVDVVLAPESKHNSGEVSIRFYPQGYADPAYIHLLDDQGRYLTLKIEPFLPRVKLFETYVSFETS